MYRIGSEKKITRRMIHATIAYIEEYLRGILGRILMYPQPSHHMWCGGHREVHMGPTLWTPHENFPIN